VRLVSAHRFPTKVVPALMAICAALGLLTAAALGQTPSSPAPAPAATVNNGNSVTTPQNNSGAQPTGQQPPAESTPSQGPITEEPPANDQNSVFVFKKQVQEVVLHAIVQDEQRHLVPNLDKSAFSVSENGMPEVITSFRREDVPVAMGIVIDNSGSMRDKREKVNQAVLNLIRASNPQDEIFVVNFSQDYYLDQDFTSDVKLLQAALHQDTVKGSTALYDAIVASERHLRNNPRLEKKVLLVITDGQDNMSQETLQEASRRLQQANGPLLYSIGILGSNMTGAGRDALQRLADGTGGVAYFPESLDEVNNITRTVAHDIRSQYIIAYKPYNQNGKPAYQSLQVEAKAPGYRKLTVRTRSGYFAPEPSAR